MEDRRPVSVADETINVVLQCIQPTLDSEEKRKEIIEYIQKLVKTTFGHEVFPYGSGPLKTYLPDGDIDLTVVYNPDGKHMLPVDLHAFLLREQLNEKAQFKVKSIHFIDGAEVKVIKFFVQNTAVDISFNQLGGLSSLCFLEKMDQVIGKDHLLKRSFILIKTWCFHESRLLGAHNGLISTYGLETMVLYIFQVFNQDLNQPLEVLYRFLDYFSKFDWTNLGVSLKGPILKSALPKIVFENPENLENDFLFSEDFLSDYTDFFTVASRLDANLKTFPVKFLNIVDPMKENNNLGRSVNKGNFQRICSAFRLGAKTLRLALESPSDEIAHSMKKFFSTTIRMHGHRLSTSENVKSEKSATSEGGSDENLVFIDSDDESSTDGSESLDLDCIATDLECRYPLSELTGEFDDHIRNLFWSKVGVKNRIYSPPLVLSNAPLCVPPQAPSLAMGKDTLKLSSGSEKRPMHPGGTQLFHPRPNWSLNGRERPTYWKHRRQNNNTQISSHGNNSLVPLERRHAGGTTPGFAHNRGPNPNRSHSEGSSSNANTTQFSSHGNNSDLVPLERRHAGGTTPRFAHNRGPNPNRSHSKGSSSNANTNQFSSHGNNSVLVPLEKRHARGTTPGFAHNRGPNPNRYQSKGSSSNANTTQFSSHGNSSVLMPLERRHAGGTTPGFAHNRGPNPYRSHSEGSSSNANTTQLSSHGNNSVLVPLERRRAGGTTPGFAHNRGPNPNRSHLEGSSSNANTTQLSSHGNNSGLVPLERRRAGGTTPGFAHNRGPNPNRSHLEGSSSNANTTQFSSHRNNSVLVPLERRRVGGTTPGFAHNRGPNPNRSHSEGSSSNANTTQFSSHGNNSVLVPFERRHVGGTRPGFAHNRGPNPNWSHSEGSSSNTNTGNIRKDRRTRPPIENTTFRNPHLTTTCGPPPLMEIEMRYSRVPQRKKEGSNLCKKE
ncbi:uncharacterized protein LOC124940179 [Impatiens glandulifera]|uniref:uncharacterized protein LOC124940179 n=1 Tax=Impatiens glandulifera TaxID=253017 RepID=UPI001FB0A86D|nr:uncharacterized protein LOC124940179 [Impatiens glandulifera]